jgi:hypothetical protein
MFGCNSHQTRLLVPIVVVVIYEIFECYCEQKNIETLLGSMVVDFLLNS